MTDLYLTSFKVAADTEHDLQGAFMPIWSSAVYQPSWLPQRPKAEWMDIRPDGKNWIRPREFIEQEQPLDGYFRALMDLYDSRYEAARFWLERVAPEPEVAIACWCPHDSAAKRQLAEWGTFVCHTAAVGYFIETRFGNRVHLDEDRRLMVWPQSEALHG